MKKLILAVILVAGVGAAGAAAWWFRQEDDEAEDRLTLHGNMEIREVQLAFRAADRIAAMNVEEGDRVQRGQLLAKLETDRSEHMVAQAEAQVAAQQAVVSRLESGTRSEEIAQARAEVAAAETEAVNQQRIYARLRDLRKENTTSQQAADNAEAAANVAESRLEAARQALRLALAGPRQEDIAAAKATLSAYEAELALARQNLADAILYAPTDGVIRNRILEPGDMASPLTPVYTLALTDPVWVRAYVDEPDLGKIRPGMTAEITTDSFPGKKYAAWVGYISPTAEFTPKSVETPELRTQLVYQVRVFAKNGRGELRLGMPATVTIPLNQPVPQGESGSEVTGQEPS